MVEGKVEPREVNWRHWLPWTEIFQGFKLALDPYKLMLAVGGVVVTALGWWVLALLFNTEKPVWNEGAITAYSGKTEDERRARAWKDYKERRHYWNIRYEAAGPQDSTEYIDALDLAETPAEFKLLTALQKANFSWTALIDDEKDDNVKKDLEKAERNDALRDKVATLKANIRKPAGRLRTWPWFEDRGPNPYLLVTGQSGRTWERGHFWEWLLTEQLPILAEPLAKMLRPVFFFFRPNIGLLNSFYFMLVTLWTLLTWAIFGGAITRIAAIQIARDEKITATEALRYTWRHLLGYLGAPLVPFLIMGLILVGMMLFGLGHLVPWLGEFIFDGLLWWLMLIAGLAMAGMLIGLVSWPMMAASVSVDASGLWDAFNYPYQYFYQSTWRYAWYNFVALIYGAVIIFVVGVVGSMAVYLSKWGVSQTPFTQTVDRDPSFLFVYAPTSFGWRELLLQGVQLQDGSQVVDPRTGKIDEANYNKFLGRDKNFVDRGEMGVVNAIGAGMVTVWLCLFFLLILSFGYSYFWSVSTLIYMLLRRDVDDRELEEVHLDEDDESPYGGPLLAGAGLQPAAVPGRQTLTMAPVAPAPTASSNTPPAAPVGSPPTASAPPKTPDAGDGAASTPNG